MNRKYKPATCHQSSTAIVQTRRAELVAKRPVTVADRIGPSPPSGGAPTAPPGLDDQHTNGICRGRATPHHPQRQPVLTTAAWRRCLPPSRLTTWPLGAPPRDWRRRAWTATGGGAAAPHAALAVTRGHRPGLDAGGVGGEGEDGLAAAPRNDFS